MLLVDQKNQTHPDWHTQLRNLSLAPEQASLGTGIFILPNPMQSADAFQTVLVPDLSYEECIERGFNCIAFKWVPEALHAFEKLTTEYGMEGTQRKPTLAQQKVVCDPFPCTGTCIGFSCFCMRGRCV